MARITATAQTTSIKNIKLDGQTLIYQAYCDAEKFEAINQIFTNGGFDLFAVEELNRGKIEFAWMQYFENSSDIDNGEDMQTWDVLKKCDDIGATVKLIATYY